ncbi:hypothetical protein D3C77_547880 [compost metagenome]
MEEAEGKINHIYRETKTLQADNLEKKGDRSLTALDYNGAIEAYTLAQEMYQEIDKLERVLAMERKIAKADEKRNPIVPAAGQDAAGSASGGGLSGAQGMNGASGFGGSTGLSSNSSSNSNSNSNSNGAFNLEGSGSQSNSSGASTSGQAVGNQSTGGSSSGSDAGTTPASETNSSNDKPATTEGGGAS